MVLNLRKAFYWSLGVHSGFLILLLIAPYLPFSPYRMRNERITWIELPRGTGETFSSALKRSPDLPKTTIQEQKNPEPQTVPKTDRMTFKKDIKEKPKPKTEEEKRIEKILAQASQEVAGRKPATPEAAQIPQGPTGGFAQGTAVGSVAPPDDPERLLYVTLVKKQVMEQWIPPLNLRDPKLGLICSLFVRINDRGEVLETKWEQRSGNEPFDLSAQRAVMKAAPLKPPPEKLKEEAVHEGFLIDFNPVLLDSLPR